MLNKDIIVKGLSGVAGYISKGIKIASPILVTMVLSGKAKDKLEDIRYSGNVKYDDAVRAIMDSSMLSRCKREIASVVKADESSEYYRGVIYIVRSSMLSSDKVDLIKELSCKVENEEEGSQA